MMGLSARCALGSSAKSYKTTRRSPALYPLPTIVAHALCGGRAHEQAGRYLPYTPSASIPPPLYYLFSKNMCEGCRFIFPLRGEKAQTKTFTSPAEISVLCIRVPTSEREGKLSNPRGRAARARCMEKIYGNLRKPAHLRRARAVR
jgi:hypothetical protein